jgi:hypothetical protein
MTDEATAGTKPGRGATVGGPGTGQKARSKRSVYWILGGLVITGILAGYNWLRQLPRD